MKSEDNKNKWGDWLILAKNGDNNAFEKIYQELYTPIFQFIYYKIGHKDESEDLTQQVFLKVYKNLDKFNILEGKNVLSYFLTIARNTVIDYWRKKKDLSLDFNDMSSHLSNELRYNPKDEYFKQENTDKILKSLKQLTEEQEEVVILKFINGLTSAEIAENLGVKEEAVRQRLHRALKKLKEILKIEQYE